MHDSNGNGFDFQKQTSFLLSYAALGSVTAAAKMSGCHRSSHGKWMRKDPSYPPRFAEARRESADRLEEEARRRAVEGVRKPIVQKGEVVFAWFDASGNIVEEGDPRATHRGPVMEHAYSDRLLEILLRGNLPAKYRDRKEVTHKGGLDVKFESKDVKLARVTEALAVARARIARREKHAQAEEPPPAWPPLDFSAN